MRIRTQHLAIVIGCAAFVACTQETFTEVEQPRSALISEFVRYASREEVVSKVSSRFQIQVVEDSSLPAGDRRPPFSIYTLSVAGFRYLDHDGELRMTFFNNRLQETWFYPNDPDAYFSALRSHGVVPSEHSQLVMGRTAVWTGTDYRVKSYVAWQDTRLGEQSKRWISRYS